MDMKPQPRPMSSEDIRLLMRHPGGIGLKLPPAPSIWKLEVPDHSWLMPNWCAYGFISRGMGRKA